MKIIGEIIQSKISRNSQKPRKHQRNNAPLLTADLSDGNNVIQGMVKDFSVDGIKMVEVPQEFSTRDILYTVIVSQGKHHFRLVVQPRWHKGNQIGFRIMDAPWKWIELNKRGQKQLLVEFGYNA